MSVFALLNRLRARQWEKAAHKSPSLPWIPLPGPLAARVRSAYRSYYNMNRNTSETEQAAIEQEWEDVCRDVAWHLRLKDEP